jgi:hypothetical protein
VEYGLWDAQKVSLSFAWSNIRHEYQGGAYATCMATARPLDVQVYSEYSHRMNFEKSVVARAAFELPTLRRQ